MKEKLEKYSYSIRKERQRKALNVILFFVLIFALVNLIISYLLFPVRQLSTSMTPDLPENSLILATPIVTNIKRGDVVLIDSKETKQEYSFFQKSADSIVRFFTAQQISPYEKSYLPGSKQKLRRVIGLPGDTFYMRDYVLYVKPAGDKHFLTEFEIAEDLYNVTFYVAPGGWDSSIGVKGSFDETVLGPDEYFVLGDNRKSCDDSRLWGPVKINDINAKALLCYFPFTSLKLY